MASPKVIGAWAQLATATAGASVQVGQAIRGARRSRRRGGRGGRGGRGRGNSAPVPVAAPLPAPVGLFAGLPPWAPWAIGAAGLAVVLILTRRKPKAG